MVYQQKIKLYKIRSFSEKLNATIEFIRQNILPLGKAVIYIIGPLSILSGLLLTQYFGFLFDNMQSENFENIQNPFGAVFNSSYFGFIILSMVSAALNISVVVNYMRLYQQKYPEEITVTEVLNLSWRDILPLVGLFVVAGVLIILSFMFFIIPGIFMMIVLSLASTALIFERKGIFEAISRSFKLIKGKWWSTFGLVVVTYFIMQAVAMIFIIPFYVFYFLGILTMVEETGISTDVNALWFQVGLTLSIIFMILGSFITQCIPVIAINFQYFNLVERQESVGLMGEIEQLDSNS